MMCIAWVEVMYAAVHHGYLSKRDWWCQRGRQVGKEPCIVALARSWVRNVLEFNKHFIVDPLVAVLRDLAAADKVGMTHYLVFCDGSATSMCKPVETTQTPTQQYDNQQSDRCEEETSSSSPYRPSSALGCEAW